ncbi:predicted protein [Methanosarcina acetivorans C2A]|uniref:Uncharacterized protein n=1 Tax=Methanosarcina acetivorans (strain ATCC 35395 / DSM 2834 / JCM 12185 / C2A) TaxID=188937 RepID=Q8TID8_METAC|nr:predicted protein [Methanosarcina acetivorans C2A]
MWFIPDFAMYISIILYINLIPGEVNFQVGFYFVSSFWEIFSKNSSKQEKKIEAFSDLNINFSNLNIN